MNLKQKAEGAPYYLITSMQECPLGRFWVVQLDSGLEIYQSKEDAAYNEPNPWMRLKQFCEDHNVRPVNMARANKNLDQSNQINLDPDADGYFYARRLRKLMCAVSSLNGYEDYAQGVGHLHGKKLSIIWEFDDGRGFEIEERNIDEHPKTQIVSLIRK